jgi:hypothetical protein
MRTVKPNQFSMSLLSSDIFSNENVKVFYEELLRMREYFKNKESVTTWIPWYSKYKESFSSHISEIGTDESSDNIVLSENRINHVLHADKYLQLDNNIDGYLGDLRNYQEIKFETRLSRTARVSTIESMPTFDNDNRVGSIILNYILSIDSLAKVVSLFDNSKSFEKNTKGINVLLENYHIDKNGKNGKDVFYENMYSLFSRIKEHGGTLIDGTMKVDVIRKNEASIIDRFDFIDKEFKDSSDRYTFSDFINKQEKNIGTSTSSKFSKDKLTTKISSSDSFLDKQDKFVSVSGDIRYSSESNLLYLDGSLVHIVTKVQKQVYRLLNTHIDKKVDRFIKIDGKLIPINRQSTHDATISKNNSYLKGSIRNVTLPEIRNYTVTRNTDMSVIYRAISIGKNQKNIGYPGRMPKIEKNQKSIEYPGVMPKIDKNQKDIGYPTKMNDIDKDQKSITENDKPISIDRPTQYEAWILSVDELGYVLPREVDIVKHLLGGSTNDRLGQVDYRIVLVEKNKETTTLFDTYFALQKEEKTILINLNQSVSHAEHIVTALDKYKQIEKQLKEVYNSVMNKFDDIEQKLVLSNKLQIDKPSKNTEIFSLPILEHLKYLDMHRLKPLQKSQKHVIISSEGPESFTRKNEILLIDKFIFTEMYQRWYFLPEDGENDGPYDWMILPMDFPYAQHPEYNIKEHPIVDGGAEALNEIPVSVKKVEDVIEFCFQLWEAHLDLYSRYTPEQAVKHFVNLIYEWLTKYLPEKIYKMPKSYPDDYGWVNYNGVYREEYWRIYRWIRWYAESIIINVLEDDKKRLVGNIYVSKLVNDLVKYFNDHHGKYGMPNVPEPSIINKVKGKRHRWLFNKN